MQHGTATRWSVALLPLVLGCAARHPFGLYDQTRPLPDGARVAAEFVTVERCTSYLFAVLSLGPAHGFPELIDEARDE